MDWVLSGVRFLLHASREVCAGVKNGRVKGKNAYKFVEGRHHQFLLHFSNSPTLLKLFLQKLCTDLLISHSRIMYSQINVFGI